jgi:hypothetical protein
MSSDCPGRERGPGHDLHHLRLSRAERRAVLTHRYFLSEKAGHDVGEETATLDWLRHHAHRWRAERCRQDAEAQKAQIDRHKWIESEKAGRDLGEAAVSDWIRRFAAAWRFQHEEEEMG